MTSNSSNPLPPSPAEKSAGPKLAAKAKPPVRLYVAMALIAGLLLGVVGGAYFAGGGSLSFLSPSASAKKATQYHCPMHPTVVQDKKGSCPICGMDLVPVDRQANAAALPTAQPAQEQATVQPAAGAVKYHCPMHPAYISDKPGNCPICGMTLVPMKPEHGSHDGEPSTVPGLATVSISPQVRQRIGLTLGLVEKRPLLRDVRTSARIVADETRQHRVTTKVDGWVEKLFVNVTGQAVKQGDPLLTIYSPALVSAQQEYLTALETRDRLAANKASDAALPFDAVLKATRRRFELWDISDDQIQHLEKTRKVETALTLYAAANGVVTEKNILAGQKIMAGDSLLVIADFRNVWADADIYQSDLPHVAVDMPVEVTLPYWPGKVFTGKVSFITPTLDPATRTVSARLEIKNPDLLLKPGMYANARLAQPMGEKLTVPEAAVIRTGDRAYAFKDGGDGKLIPVTIKIGTHSDGYFEVTEGLQEGQQVVTSANFLVDSESSLKAALAAMTVGKTEGGEAPDPHAGHRR